MMSGHSANPIFFNKKKQRLDIQNTGYPASLPLRPITPHFGLTAKLPNSNSVRKFSVFTAFEKKRWFKMVKVLKLFEVMHNKIQKTICVLRLLSYTNNLHYFQYGTAEGKKPL